MTGPDHQTSASIGEEHDTIQVNVEVPILI